MNLGLSSGRNSYRMTMFTVTFAISTKDEDDQEGRVYFSESVRRLSGLQESHSEAETDCAGWQMQELQRILQDRCPLR